MERRKTPTLKPMSVYTVISNCDLTVDSESEDSSSGDGTIVASGVLPDLVNVDICCCARSKKLLRRGGLNCAIVFFFLFDGF